MSSRSPVLAFAFLILCGAGAAGQDPIVPAGRQARKALRRRPGAHRGRRRRARRHGLLQRHHLLARLQGEEAAPSRPATSGSSTPRPARRPSSARPAACPTASSSTPTGNMIVAEGADYGGRRVTRTDMKTGKSYIIAGLFEGRPFNSPNDITIDEKGRIYFSDPRYLGHEPIDQPVQAVYRIDPDGSIHRIITDAGKPNGVLRLARPEDAVRRQQRQRHHRHRPRARRRPPLTKGRMALLAYDLAAGRHRQVPQDAGRLRPAGRPRRPGRATRTATSTSPSATKRGPASASTRRRARSWPTSRPRCPTNVGFGRGAEARRCTSPPARACIAFG